jgi:L-idonate 5-dehydrogenase
VAHGAQDLRVEAREVALPGPGQVLVEVAYGGICGSDLHYYQRGAVGDFVLREPLVLGHEVVGRVAAAGPDTDASPVGTEVAIHPATPCGECRDCLAGRRQVCAHVRYLGSAARFPHVQGGFASTMLVPVQQVHALPSGLSLVRAAVAEPLSVALHAVRRAGDVRDASALVVGAGPIGCLAVVALRAAGAREVVATDIVEEAVAVARASGADAGVIAGSKEADALDQCFDVVIEASGASAGLATALRAVRRGGTVVQLGLLPPGEVPFAGNVVVTREISVVGAFRFDSEFTEALDLLASGLPSDPVVTDVLPVAASRAAFDLAGDRHRACKVLLDFATP